MINLFCSFPGLCPYLWTPPGNIEPSWCSLHWIVTFKRVCLAFSIFLAWAFSAFRWHGQQCSRNVMMYTIWHNHIQSQYRPNHAQTLEIPWSFRLMRQRHRGGGRGSMSCWNRCQAPPVTAAWCLGVKLKDVKISDSDSLGVIFIFIFQLQCEIHSNISKSWHDVACLNGPQDEPHQEPHRCWDLQLAQRIEVWFSDPWPQCNDHCFSACRPYPRKTSPVFSLQPNCPTYGSQTSESCSS